MDIFQVIGSSRFPKKDVLSNRRISEKIRPLGMHEAMHALQTYIDALDALNTHDIGNYALASGLAPDEYHFLNLRAGVIMQGRKCFERVLVGDYAPLEKLRDFTWIDWRLDEAIKSPLWAAYYRETGSNIFDDAPFFSDARFVRHLQNPAYAPKNRAPVLVGVEIDDKYAREYYRVMRYKYVECAHFACLGIVRQGTVLRHASDGLCWVYQAMFLPYGKTWHVKALFKKDGILLNASLGDSPLWKPCMENDWQE